MCTYGELSFLPLIDSELSFLPLIEVSGEKKERGRNQDGTLKFIFKKVKSYRLCFSVDSHNKNITT